MAEPKKFCLSSMLSAMSAEIGVHYAVVSSGSRSMPIVTAFDVNPDIEVRMVADERVAAFAALGVSGPERQPVALVCTSGSAMLNYAPAVAEAYYSGMPLIVITADRPAWSIDQNVGQTIRQYGALANIVKCSIDVDGDTDNPLKWQGMVADALVKAISGKPGPVHINVHLSEPLKETFSENVPHGLVPEVYVASCLMDITLQDLASQTAGRKVMVFVSASASFGMNKFPMKVVQNKNIVVVADIPTQLCQGANIYDIDTALRLAGDDCAACPEILITIGGAPVSRKFREWIESHTDIDIWSIVQEPVAQFTFGRLSKVIVAQPTQLLSRLSNANGSFYEYWSKLSSEVHENHISEIYRMSWSTDVALSCLFNSFEKPVYVHLSNGMTLRTAIRCFNRNVVVATANRGVNGIDGSTSTALGYAFVHPETTNILITGDMSALYDVGALQSGLLRNNFRMVVVNNCGGDIFRHIDATKNVTYREELLCKVPDIDWHVNANAARMLYYSASSEQELLKILPKFFAEGKAALLELKF